MSELTLLLLRVGFLLALWLFILAVLYALRSDLFGAPARKMPADAAGRRSSPITPTPGTPIVKDTAPVPPSPVITPSGGALPSAAATGATESITDLRPLNTAPTNDGSSGANAARVLVITSGSSAGTTLPLDENSITIGRSNDSTLVIVDEYTSSYHAKLSRNGDQWLLTDLDSTNGTKLNGSRVNGTVLVPLFTPITIGTTTFELRP